eukprot:m.37313 g.37313  ORF g.37313 m.37313 type:complete len:332 (+) comp11530_c0_seq1:226-1221(+)
MFRSALAAVPSQVRSASQMRLASTLVWVEHDETAVKQSTLNTIAAAKKIGGDITALVVGTTDKVAADVAKIAGVNKVLVAKGDAYKGLLPEAVAPTIVALQKKYNFTHILAPTSTRGKNILPRVAATLDVGMVSDVTDVLAEDTFERPIYAGNAIMTVKSKDKVKVATVRNTAFAPVAATGGSAATEAVEGGAASSISTFVKQDLVKSERPPLPTARVVIAGGRGMQNGDNFKILYELADKMGAAVGASRAAVDSGFCSNDMQIGQTGLIVAPELYIGAGVSGASQHIAGMKDSKTIVVINKDAEAPFFEIADYGLVADLFKAVPEMTKKL